MITKNENRELDRCFIICRAPIETAFPIINIAISIKRSGIVKEVFLVTSTFKAETEKFMKENGIHLVGIDSKYNLSNSKLLKLRNWFIFNRKIWKYLKENILADKTILYVGTGDTALVMGKKLFKLPYILHLRELYDQKPYYLKKLKPFAQKAQQLVVPEYNRGAIYQSLYKLKKSPVIIPNRPVTHPFSRNMNVHSTEAAKVLSHVNGKKIILYQGLVADERDLTTLARAVKDLSEKYVLLLLGRDYGHLKEVLAENPDVLHIPFVSPPGHLEITSHAHVGIVTYSYRSLNTIFCAPNKIWEYAGFGIPMLANNLPGLKYTVEKEEMGLCIDFNNIDEIKTGILEIESNFETFSKNAISFFKDFDMNSQIKKLFET